MVANCFTRSDSNARFTTIILSRISRNDASKGFQGTGNLDAVAPKRAGEESSLSNGVWKDTVIVESSGHSLTHFDNAWSMLSG